MLYFNNFKNFTEFSNLFGVMEHGNGNKSRRNKILLALLTSRDFWKGLRTAPLSVRYDGRPIDENQRAILLGVFRALTDMASLRKQCIRFMGIFEGKSGYECNIRVDVNEGGQEYAFLHDVYEVDNGGVCYDGDTNSIRYINHESGGRIFKMKAGKFLRRLIDANQFGKLLPEQVKVWLCEDFAERWRAYSQQKIASDTLHVSEDLEDFRRIYTSENYDGDFGSCMSHDRGDHASFYVDAVKAKAAWLENNEGRITARCVIFTDVTDGSGNKWRLAERQYSTNGDNVLKRTLVDKLIAAGEIDAYKQIGVDCHNATAWVKNDGTSISDKQFSIECNLDEDDVMSYMDSFKWYDMDSNTAYNYPADCDCYDLADTSLYFRPHDGKVWSEYESGWIDEDYARYVDSREDWFNDDDTRYCVNTRTYEFRDDCVELENGDFAYYGYDCEGYDGVSYCENCGCYFLDEDMRYSELLDEYYCCCCARDLEKDYMEEHAKEKGYRYDEYDQEWYDPEEWDDVRILVWRNGKRKNAYTRRRNVASSYFAMYCNNWYAGHLFYDGAQMWPREVFEDLH